VIVPEPLFLLTLAAARLDTTPGISTSVSVTIDRVEGRSNPIEVSAEHLPEGISGSSVTSRPGEASAKLVTQTLSAGGCSHADPFRIDRRKGGWICSEPSRGSCPDPWVRGEDGSALALNPLSAGIEQTVSPITWSKDCKVG